MKANDLVTDEYTMISTASGGCSKGHNVTVGRGRCLLTDIIVTGYEFDTVSVSVYGTETVYGTEVVYGIEVVYGLVTVYEETIVLYSVV